MPVYIALTRLNEVGREAVKTSPRKIKANKAALEAMGVKVLGQYITLGRYDFINIFEAKNEETILKAAVNLSGKGIAHTETLVALTIDEYLKIGKKRTR
ncbi:MAG: GYD domain-containing protein [Dehalococcoidia bacterium]|nr:GYD domain-containing protein [Dehalococcoidia bacterium]